LTKSHPFKGSVVSQALQTTFVRRQTPFPVDIPTALTDRFVNDRLKQIQWKAFVRKGHLAAEQVSLSEVVELLRGFLMPPMRAAAKKESFHRHWPVGGPWT
ncbi:MAG: hypothetical protein OEW32_04570, partial [Nitrospira sp.]|nr:hypothetical protein [Nitrospira sp.]